MITEPTYFAVLTAGRCTADDVAIRRQIYPTRGHALHAASRISSLPSSLRVVVCDTLDQAMSADISDTSSYRDTVLVIR